MAWYQIPIIFVGVLGLILMALSSFDNKKLMTYGLLLLVIALVAEAALWFASLF